MDTVEEWEKQGFSCDIWSDPPGQVWKNFIHATDELLMLIEGEIELSFQGKVLHPAPGGKLFIPAGVMHTVINIGDTRNRWYYGYHRG